MSSVCGFQSTVFPQDWNWWQPRAVRSLQCGSCPARRRAGKEVFKNRQTLRRSHEQPCRVQNYLNRVFRCPRQDKCTETKHLPNQETPLPVYVNASGMRCATCVAAGARCWSRVCPASEPTPASVVAVAEAALGSCILWFQRGKACLPWSVGRSQPMNPFRCAARRLAAFASASLSACLRRLMTSRCGLRGSGGRSCTSASTRIQNSACMQASRGHARQGCTRTIRPVRWTGHGGAAAHSDRAACQVPTKRPPRHWPPS